MIDVAITPAEVRPADVAVVIDVLRATSTAVQALAAGYQRVLFVDTLARARALRAPGRVLAGERACVAPPDFDLGNSPRATDPPRGTDLVLTTTNGSPAILAAARSAETVLLGCLLNLDAVVAAIPRGDVQLVCSGTDGRLALEDVYVAGRIAARLDGERTDAARAAECVALRYPEPLAALTASEDARRLARLGQDDDVAWCAGESTLDAVPRVLAAVGGVATVGLPDRHRRKTINNAKYYALTLYQKGVESGSTVTATPGARPQA